MTVLAVIIAFLLGAAGGAVTLWRVLPARLRQHTDYKQRWEDAIGLLGSQGQLTPEQVAKLAGGEKAAPGPAAPRLPLPAMPSTLATLHSMASWDRKDIEIARARKGLPPVDDLVGMASWDKKAVLKAQAEAS